MTGRKVTVLMDEAQGRERVQLSIPIGTAFEACTYIFRMKPSPLVSVRQAVTGLATKIVL